MDTKCIYKSPEGVRDNFPLERQRVASRRRALYPSTNLIQTTMQSRIKSHRKTFKTFPSYSELMSDPSTQKYACDPDNPMSMSPAEADRLRKMNRPVTLGNLPEDSFDDGCTNPSITTEYCRGSSLVDLWNESNDAKKKIINAKNQN